MNIDEIYEKLKDQNRDLIELLENELSSLDKNKIFDLEFEKNIVKIIKNYNRSLNVKYERDVNYFDKKKETDLIIEICSKNIKMEVIKSINKEETKYYFSFKTELDNFCISERNLNYTHAVKDKNSVLDELIIVMQADKENRFLLKYINNEWDDYLSGNSLNKEQGKIYLQIQNYAEKYDYDIDLIKIALNNKDEIATLKEYIELEKLMDDSTVLEDFFIKTNMIGKLNLNDFTINKNEGLIQTLIKTKNNFFGKM